MKKFSKLIFLIPLIVILGIVFIIIGNTSSNSGLARAGLIILQLGLPIVMLAMVSAAIIMMMKGASDSNDKNDDETISQKEKEYSEINDINTSYGRQSRYKEADYIAHHTSKAYKNSNKKEKIFSFALFGFLIGNIFLVFIFGFFKIKIGVFVCLGLFAGTILLCFIIKTILEKVSIHARVSTKKKDREIMSGIVKACLLSSASTRSGTSKNATTRVTGVTYRIIISANGMEYTAYSNEFYEEGEPVAFALLKGRFVSIVDIEELKKEIQEKSSLLK